MSHPWREGSAHLLVLRVVPLEARTHGHACLHANHKAGHQREPILDLASAIRTRVLWRTEEIIGTHHCSGLVHVLEGVADLPLAHREGLERRHHAHVRTVGALGEAQKSQRQL